MKRAREDGYALVIVLGLTLAIFSLMALVTSVAHHHRQMNRRALQDLQSRALTVPARLPAR